MPGVRVTIEPVPSALYEYRCITATAYRVLFVVCLVPHPNALFLQRAYAFRLLLLLPVILSNLVAACVHHS